MLMVMKMLMTITMVVVVDDDDDDVRSNNGSGMKSFCGVNTKFSRVTISPLCGRVRVMELLPPSSSLSSSSLLT